MSKIHAIIVSRGLTGMLRACLGALSSAARQTGTDLRVSVVDNASERPYRLGRDLGTDRTGRIIRLDTHHSFAACCNLAAADGLPGDLLLLNNDVFLEPSSLAGMADMLAREQLGICGAGLAFPDGSVQHSGVVFGPDDIGPYHRLRLRQVPTQMRSDSSLQAVTGACMMIKREVYEALGGLDEEYPFGLEDIDFCLRARARGLRVGCFLDDFSLHMESMTEGRVKLDVPSRRLFMDRWKGRYTIDG